MGASEKILYFLNTITFILGAVVLGLAIFIRVNFADGWDTFVSLTAVNVGIAAGLLMMLVSFLGCCSAYNTNKTVLCVYALLVTIVLAMQIAAAVLLMQYSGIINDQNDIISSDLTEKTAIEINNGVLSTYTACCSGCPDVSPCDNDEGTFFFNTTGIGCTGQTQTCTFVEVCDVANNVNSTCFQALNGGAVKNPPIKVDKTLCTILGKIKQDGKAIVGPADDGSCGAGEPATFQKDVNDYFASNFKFVAIGFSVIAALQFMVILASAYIICCKTQKYDKT